MFSEAPFALAFGAGMLAAFNPCGFALLPAYLGWFLGLDGGTGTGAVQGPASLRSLLVGGFVTAGFVSVFAFFGILARAFSVAINDFTPYLTFGLGLLMVPIGLLLAAGRQIKLRVPTVKRGPSDRTLPAVFAFGASYAIVSLGCTLPTFLTPVVPTLNRDLASGVAVFGAYAAGIALVLISLTLVIGLARASMVRHFRRVLPYVGRASGVLLVLTGGYVAYYGWYEIQLFVHDRTDVRPGPIDWVTDRTDALATWVSETGPTRLGLFLAAAMAAMVVTAVIRRRGRRVGTKVSPGGGP